MTKRTLSFGFLAMTIILFTFSCEKRFLDIPHEPATESQVELLKAYFENYSRNLPPPDSQNFTRLARSGSERILHWDRAETIGKPEMGILRVPVSYTGQQTFIQDSAGEKHPLGDNTWLVAWPRKEGEYKLNLVTYLPLEQTTQEGENPYTAVLEVGDWQGRHEFAVLYRKQGSPVMVKNRDTNASSNTPSSQTLRMAVDISGSYVCVQTGTICVAVYVEGTENYDSTIWSCGPQFKCYFADGTLFNPEEYPDFDIPDTWYGGNNEGDDTAPSGNNNPPSELAVLDQIENKPFALLDIPCETIQAWVNTAKKQVQQAQISKLNQIISTTTLPPDINITTVARLQNINNAYSTVVNMDYFPITITQLPIINGVRQTPEQFLEHIRKNINSFVNTSYSTFIPYQWYGVNDIALWNSSNPLGAVVALDIPGPDNGSVIVSDYSSTGWTFSTIFDPMYASHPVSGHRDFGFTQNTNGSYTFYTRAVDRLTNAGGTTLKAVADFLLPSLSPFAIADALWESFQSKIENFVNTNGGNSTVSDPQIYRPDWQQVKDVLEGRAPLSTLSRDCPD